MVYLDFYDLSNLNENTTNIGTLLAIPNSSYPYFWAWILLGIWLIITSTLYFKEKEKIGRGKLLASMSVACFCIIILATLGSLLGIITSEIMIRTLVLCIVIIAIWFFTTP